MNRLQVLCVFTSDSREASKFGSVLATEDRSLGLDFSTKRRSRIISCPRFLVTISGHVRCGRWTVPWCTLRGPSNSLGYTCSGSRENYESTLCRRQCTWPDGVRANRNLASTARGTSLESAYEVEGGIQRLFKILNNLAVTTLLSLLLLLQRIFILFDGSINASRCF